MTDKTLGAYERHESPDYADGGVTAALIEEEAEQRACPDLDAHWRLDEAQETIQRLTQERDEALAGVRVLARENIECHERAAASCGHPNHGSRDHDCGPFTPAAESRPLAPGAITDEMIQRGESYMKSRPWTVSGLLRAALTEPPARPEELTRLIDTIREATYDPEPVATGEALYNAGVRVVGEERS